MKQFIKEKLNGRTQRWLCEKIKMSEVDFSNSLGGIHRQFRKFEWEKISDALGLSEVDMNHPSIVNYKFSDKQERAL